MTSLVDTPRPTVAATDELSRRDELRIRPATADDVSTIHALIRDHLVSGHLLARPREELDRHRHGFYVVADASRVVGCGELIRLSPTLAEIRSLVVTEAYQGRGLGGRLLEVLVEQAGSPRPSRVCAFTHRPKPFVRAGFSIVPHPWLPEKIAKDCQGCTWFRRCRQYAVVLDLTPHHRSTR